MALSLTEFRQQLFKLADRVIETGEPLLLTRNGVGLRLIRDEPARAVYSRLGKLKAQDLTVGAALRPDESPAQWSAAAKQVAESGTAYRSNPRKPARKRKSP